MWQSHIVLCGIVWMHLKNESFILDMRMINILRGESRAGSLFLQIFFLHPILCFAKSGSNYL